MRWWKEFRALLQRELDAMSGDSNILLVLLAGPIVYTLIFGLVYYNDKVYDVPIVVVDRDASALSRTIVRSLDANEAIKVIEVARDESELQEKFRTEECWGAVMIPPEFEKNVKRGIPVNVLVLTNSSNMVVGNYAVRGVQSVLATLGAGVSIGKMERRGMPGDVAKNAYAPVGLQSRILFNPASNYANFVVPLLLILLIHQVVLLACSMSWAKEFELGTVRTLAGPLHDGALLAGKSLPYLAAGLLLMAMSVFGAHTWLAIPFEGNLGILLLMAVLLTVDVVLLGAILGMAIQSKVGVVQVLFFTSMPAVLISGESWPLDSMPLPLHWFSLVLPSTHAMSIYRRLALEGAGIAELWPSILALAVIGVALYGGLYAMSMKLSKQQ